MPKISIEDQIQCVEREIGMRERMYPRWVQQGTMKPEISAKEIERMRAVLETLNSLKQKDLFS